MNDQAIVIDTPEGIEMYRLLALRYALKLEIVGMKRRGPSAYILLKREFGFRGDKAAVLAQLLALIAIKKETGITA